MRIKTVKEKHFKDYVDSYSNSILKRTAIRWQVIVCWISPITGKFDSRTAFFSEAAEADIYEQFLSSTYEEYGFEYIIDKLYIGE